MYYESKARAVEVLALLAAAVVADLSKDAEEGDEKIEAFSKKGGTVVYVGSKEDVGACEAFGFAVARNPYWNSYYLTRYEPNEGEVRVIDIPFLAGYGVPTE